jgi:hypothetical protein
MKMRFYSPKNFSKFGLPKYAKVVSKAPLLVEALNKGVEVSSIFKFKETKFPVMPQRED